MTRIVWTSLVVLLTSLWMSLPAAAQETTGIILGSVRDPSGALMPGVRLTIVNSATGAIRRATSDAQGIYQAPLLPPGIYRLSAEHPGFQRAVREGVRVEVTERVVVDFLLSVGAVEESVTVSEATLLVQSETVAQGRVIAGGSIRALPLSTRNYTHLLGLTPGVTQALSNADRPGLGNVNPNVNGMRAGSNNLLIDGLPANNALNNSPTGIGAPSLDFLQEFKVLTNLFSVEYGRQLGSVVNVLTRSGSNEFHGATWEFIRNTKLNARPFFGVARGQNAQNQFGANIGGPVVVPGYNGRNRTFFFGGFEGTRQRNSNSTSSLTRVSLPTPAMRGGAFSRLVRDPLLGLGCTAADTRGCFPGNVIPTSRIHPISRAILERYVPLPNAVTGSAINYVEARTIQAGNDQYLTRLDHTFSEKDQFQGRWFYSRTPENTPFGSSNTIPGFDQLNTRAKYSLALTHTHIFSGTRINELRLGWDRSLSIQLGLDQSDPKAVGIPATNDLRGSPQIGVTGYTTFGNASEYRDNVHLYTIGDTFTWIRGKHSFKLGGEVRRARIQPMNLSTNRPQWVFNGQNTGDAFADFLPDLPSRGTYGVGPGILNLRETSYSAFLADNFKVTQRLTLDLGLRYELNLPPHDAQTNLVSFWPDRYRGPGSPESAGIVVANVTPGVPSSTVFTDRNNLAPRLGFAFSPGGGGLVIRGGAGLFFEQRSAQVAQQFFSNPPVLAERVINFPIGGQPDGFVYRVEGLDPKALPVPTATSAFRIRAAEKDTKTDMAQQWNLDVQRELPGKVLVQAAYVGTHGVHLFLQRNINYPQPNQAGVFTRPFAGFADIRYQNNNGNSIYHSGQFTVQKRFAGGSQFLAAYTISKTIDDAGSTERYYVNAVGDPANFRSNRGLATFDRPQRFVVSYNFAVPNPFGANASGGWRLLSGWEVSGISVLQSGIPITVTNPQSGLAWDGDAGSAGSGSRADYVGGDPYTSGGTRGRLQGWFNRPAFAPAPRTRFGTLGRNVLRGPGQHNLDIAIQKNLPIRESLALAFRSEFFNVFNHANFSGPASNLDASTFGVISSTAANARIIQFALKLSF